MFFVSGQLQSVGIVKDCTLFDLHPKESDFLAESQLYKILVILFDFQAYICDLNSKYLIVLSFRLSIGLDSKL